MSVFDRFRPKWTHSDAAVRREAVRGLTDQSILEKLADTDPDETVRLAAVESLTDQSVLAQFARGSTLLAVAAMKRVSDRALIASLAQTAELWVVREMAVDKIEDGALLHRISASDPDARVRLKARAKSPWPDQTKDYIRKQLANLQLAEPPAVAAEFSGRLIDVCEALIGDKRFRLNAGVESSEAELAELREIDAAARREPAHLPPGLATPNEICAKFLAFKRAESGDPDVTAAAAVFFQINIWRSQPDTFHCRVEEKRLHVASNAVAWSRLSSGTAHPAGVADAKEGPDQTTAAIGI